jgi:hypothetical protein
VKFNSRKFAVLKSAEPKTASVCNEVTRCGECHKPIAKKMGGVLFKRDLALAVLLL